MSKQKAELMSVRILPNTTSNPPGKLADAEVVFEADAGPFTGLKLIGFAIWERRTGGRNVTFPARQYSVNGERRSFALLRPANGDTSAQEAIRDAILDAYILDMPLLDHLIVGDAGRYFSFREAGTFTPQIADGVRA